MKTQIIQSGPGGRRSRRGVAAWIRRHRLISFFVVGALLAAIIVIAVAEGKIGRSWSGW
jgi:hypothetical protein